MGFGIGADSLESKRTGETELAKAELELQTSQTTLAKGCGEARTTAAPENLLEQACGKRPPADEAEGSSPEAAAETAFKALATARSECRSAAREAGTPAAACAEIDRAIAAAVGQP